MIHFCAILSHHDYSKADSWCHFSWLLLLLSVILLGGISKNENSSALRTLSPSCPGRSQPSKVLSAKGKSQSSYIKLKCLLDFMDYCDFCFSGTQTYQKAHPSITEFPQPYKMNGNSYLEYKFRGPAPSVSKWFSGSHSHVSISELPTKANCGAKKICRQPE